MTHEEMLKIIERVDTYLDSHGNPEYRKQPLAQHWSRVTKVCSEAGEVWEELSKVTGENARKGYCGSTDALLSELGDTACAALLGMQHITKDAEQTWHYFLAALEKANGRITQ